MGQWALARVLEAQAVEVSALEARVAEAPAAAVLVVAVPVVEAQEAVDRVLEVRAQGAAVPAAARAEGDGVAAHRQSTCGPELAAAARP